MIIRDYSRIAGIFLVVFFIIFGSYAQQPFGWQVLGQQELQGARINCMYQDSRGYVWFGTDNGLMRSTGNEIKNIEIPGLHANEGITALAENPKQTLWLGTSGGRIFKLKDFEFPEIIASPETLSSKIVSLVFLSSAEMVIGSYGEGLFIYDSSHLIPHPLNSQLSDYFIYDIELLPNESMAVATDNGINIVSKNEVKVITQKDGLPDFIVKTLAMDANGNLLAGMHENGFCSINLNTNEIQLPNLNGWDHGIVNGIVASDGKAYIASSKGGLMVYNTKQDALVKLLIPSINSPERINNLMQDDEGNLWMHDHHTVYFSLGEKILQYADVNGIQLKNIHALHVNQKNNTWFANDQGLFLMFPGRGKTNQIQSFQLPVDLSRQKIMSLYEDPKGFLWVGTFGQGLMRLNPANGKVQSFDQDEGLINGNILAIKGNETEIWLATLGGACRIALNDKAATDRFQPIFENFGTSEGLINNYIYDIFVFGDRVWFATDGSGIIKYQNGQFKPLVDDDDFNQKVIYSLTGDDSGNLWFIIANEGLFHFDGYQVNKVYQDDEHASKGFTGLLLNKEDRLFISHDDGLDVYNPLTGSFIHYEENAGLENVQSDLNTLDCDSDGNVWYGTYKGIFKIKNKPPAYRTEPIVLLDKVLVYLEETNHLTNTTFGYSDNHFSFSWAGLWYQHPEKVYYKVKLEGHDLDWIDTKNTRVIYSNLSSGEYTFKVKAGLYGNFNASDEATWTFTIKPPFWMAVWFYVLVAVLLVGMVILIVKIRERSLRRKQEILREKVMFQFENLRSQINPHFLFNSFSTLIALIDIKPEEAIKYVNELSALFRNILEYKDKDLITIKEELHIVSSYISLHQKRYGNNLQIELVGLHEIEAKMIPPLTLQLLIENALKHNVVSSTKPLNIQLIADTSKGFIFVKNNLQLKKEVEPSTGIGIKNIINRYKILTNREIFIDKSETTYSVGLPIIEPES